MNVCARPISPHDLDFTERLLRATLSNYVEWMSCGRESIDYSNDRDIPEELRDAAEQFKGYTWARSSSGCKAFGICALKTHWICRLTDVESAIYEPLAKPYILRRTACDALEYYLILELFSKQLAHAQLALHDKPREWQLLDEHLVQVPPARELRN